MALRGRRISRQAASSQTAVQQTPALGILLAGLSLSRTSTCNLVFVGSSTTAGNNATTAANRYTDLLTSTIQARYPSGLGSEAPMVTDPGSAFGTPSTTVGVHGYNGGQASTTSANYLTAGRRTTIGALNPRAVFHMVGSNDAQAGVPVATYKANVEASIADLQAKTSGPCVHVLLHSYQRFDVIPVVPWAEYGRALSQIALANPTRVAFVDLSSAYIALGVPGSDPLNLIDTDNIHQNDAGHAYMADLLRRLVLDGYPNFGTAAAVGGASASVYPSDNFNRANGPLGSTPVGGVPWTVTRGTGSVSSNALSLTVTGNSGAAQVNDGIADGTFTTTIGAANNFLLIGGPTAGDGYYFMYSGGGQVWRFGRVETTVNGPGALVALVTGPATPAPTAGTVISVTRQGNTFTCRVNGATVITATDATFAGGSHHGVGAVGGNSGLFDDWSHTA